MFGVKGGKVIQVGDFVEYDAGEGTDRWEVLSVNGDDVQLVNCCGGTVLVSSSFFDN